MANKTKEYRLNVVNVRLVKETSLYSEKKISSPDDVIDLMRDELKTYDREVFCILNLKSDGSVINMSVVSVGTLNASLVSPREVFKSSILSNAAGIIALHNHPSGNTTPSQDDIETTKRLEECGKLLDIKLVDHIIVGAGNDKHYSFKREGLIVSEPQNPYRSNHQANKRKTRERSER